MSLTSHPDSVVAAHTPGAGVTVARSAWPPGASPDLACAQAALRAAVAAEERLFRLVGAWVPVTPEPEVKLAFASWSEHHAWHAEVLASRLGVLTPPAGGPPDLPAGTGCCPGQVDWVAFADRLAGYDTTLDRLGGYARVGLPRLLAAHHATLRRATGPADGPLARVLRLVTHDLREDLLAAEVLTQSLVVDAGTARSLGVVLGDLEATLLGG